MGALGEGPGQWGGGAGGLSHPPSGGLQGLGKVSGSSPLTLRTVGWALGCGQSYSSAPGAPPDPPQGLGGGQIESIRGPLPQRDPLSSPKTGQQSCVRVGARPGCPWGQRCIWGGWGCSLGLQPCSRLHAPCPRGTGTRDLPGRCLPNVVFLMASPGTLVCRSLRGRPCPSRGRLFVRTARMVCCALRVSHGCRQLCPSPRTLLPAAGGICGQHPAVGSMLAPASHPDLGEPGIAPALHLRVGCDPPPAAPRPPARQARRHQGRLLSPLCLRSLVRMAGGSFAVTFLILNRVAPGRHSPGCTLPAQLSAAGSARPPARVCCQQGGRSRATRG